MNNTSITWELKGTLAWSIAIGLLLAISQIIPLFIYALVVEPDVDLNVLRRYMGLMENDAFLLGFMAIGSTLILVPLVLWMAKLKKDSDLKDYFSLNAVSMKVLGFWLLIAILLLLFQAFFMWLMGLQQIPDSMLNIEYPSELSKWLLVLGVAFFAPVLEEVIFRGFLLKGLANSPLGAYGAIFLTSLVWAVIHAQYEWGYLVLIFMIGLVLGYARIRTNSLFVPIMMHVFFNLVACIELYLVKG
ncbi:MAG: Unknown protein, partial [uncultured Sulfurovum sp.]